MVETLTNGATLGATRAASAVERPDFVDWLRTGRLTLVGLEKQPVGLDEWSRLPADVRARALADFDRVVAGNTKAAVLFLR